MAVFVLMLVFVCDSGNGNRYQIITDTHRNHAAGKYSANSIVPQEPYPFQMGDIQRINLYLALQS